MADFKLRSRASRAPNTTIERFSPRWAEAITSYETDGSVITTGPNSFVSHWVFRHNTAIGGLYLWRSRDLRSHANLAYDEVKDWRGCVLRFRVQFDGIRNFQATSGAPALSINLGTGEQLYINLANYIVDGEDDDVTVEIDWDTVMTGFDSGQDFDRTNIAEAFFNLPPPEYMYGQCELAAAYTAGPGSLTIDVTSGNGLPFQEGDTLALEEPPMEITSVAHLSGDNYRLTLANPLNNNWPDGQACYVVTPAESYQPFDSERVGTLTISEITVTGVGKDIPRRYYPAYPHPLAMADDLSFRKVTTPEWLVEHLLALGYSERYNFYWSTFGTDHLEFLESDPIPDTPGYERGGRWEIQASDPTFNDAVRPWLVDLVTRLTEAGFSQVKISQSLEKLRYFMPEGWSQVDADGNLSASGYTPIWTNFIDPCNEDAKAYLLGMAADFKAICDEAGAGFYPQFGEPNLWNGYANQTQYGTDPKPCFYGQAMIDRFASDHDFNLAGMTFSMAASTRTITSAALSGKSISPGDWVRVAGFANSGNNGWFQVEGRSGTSLALTADTLTSPVDESAGAAVTIKRTPPKYTNNSPTLTSRDYAALAKLKGYLEEFLWDIADGYTDAGAVKTTVLVLPDFFLYDQGGLYNAVNRAREGLLPSVWDVAQLELYGADQRGDLATQRLGYDFMRKDLGWPIEDMEYFAGFVATPYANGLGSVEQQWQNVHNAALHAISQGFQKVYIWALPQVTGNIDGVFGFDSYEYFDPSFAASRQHTWFADPTSQSGADGSFVCTRSGYKAPSTLKRTVGGRDYIKKYAPRSNAKEH